MCEGKFMAAPPNNPLIDRIAENFVETSFFLIKSFFYGRLCNEIEGLKQTAVIYRKMMKKNVALRVVQCYFR